MNFLMLYKYGPTERKMAAKLVASNDISSTSRDAIASEKAKTFENAKDAMIQSARDNHGRPDREYVDYFLKCFGVSPDFGDAFYMMADPDRSRDEQLRRWWEPVMPDAAKLAILRDVAQQMRT